MKIMKSIHNIAVLFVGLLLITSCGSTDKQSELESLKKQREEIDARITELEADLKTGAESTKRTVSVNTTKIEKQSFSHYIEVQGRVDGEDNIAVSAQTPGVVTSILVKEGDKVRAGQVLAQLENSALQQEYESRRTQLDLAKNIYNRRKALWDQQIGSEVQYLESKTAVEAGERGLAALSEQLEMTRIKSPISGSVEEVNLKLGQMAQPGMPAVRVVNFSTIKVIADIAETYATRVKPGADVIVSFPDLKQDIKTKVHFTSKYINPVNRTFLTEVHLKPGDIVFRANMIAIVKINDYVNPEAIVIPLSLLRETTEGRYVYVANEKEGQMVAQRRVVETGQSYNGQAEVVKGLKEGDVIITTGFNNLVDGQPLKVI